MRLTKITMQHPDEFLTLVGTVVGVGLGSIGGLPTMVLGGLLGGLFTLLVAHAARVPPEHGPHQ